MKAAPSVFDRFMGVLLVTFASGFYRSSTRRATSAFFQAASNSLRVVSASLVFLCALRLCQSPNSERPFFGLAFRSSRKTQCLETPGARERPLGMRRRLDRVNVVVVRTRMVRAPLQD